MKFENKRKEFENKVMEYAQNVQQLNKKNTKKKGYFSPKIININKVPSLPPIKSSNRSREKEDIVKEYVSKNENSLNLNEVSMKSVKKSPYYFNDLKIVKMIENKQILSQKRKLVDAVNHASSSNINAININHLLDGVNLLEDDYILYEFFKHRNN